MARVLVTGGAGFIGSHLVEALLRRGDKVRVLDDLSTGHRHNLVPWMNDLDFIEGDCSSPEIARRAVEGVELVFHEAAVPSVPRSVADPVATDRANVGGTVTMLDAARAAGVRRFVFAASSAAYGDTPTLPKVETMQPRPLSPYAIQKLAGEHYCRVFFETHGLETVALRYFNVFGPRQDPQSDYAAVIPKFATSILSGRPVPLFGDGAQSRDFTPVGDVVRANILAAASPRAPGHVINVARGERLTLLDLAARLGRLAGVVPELLHRPPRAGDVRDSLADVGRARDLLGFEPSANLDPALQEVLEHYRVSK